MKQRKVGKKPPKSIQRPHRNLLGLAVLLAFAGEGWAQQVVGQNAEATVSDANVISLEAIEVTGEAEEAPKVGTTTGLGQEDIERRNASHMTRADFGYFGQQSLRTA